MTIRYENKKLKQGYTHIIGCDEVGRGCLAGPVVAAAVIFNFETRPKWLLEINDSKKLMPEKREYLSKLIKSHAVWSIGEVSSEVVDEINIHNASLLAMKRAVENLPQSVVARFIEPTKPDLSTSSRWPVVSLSNHKSGNYKSFLCVDGKFKVPNLNIHQEAIIEGDGKVLSIAAASIVAKVYRDALMAKLHKQYPVYNFRQHKGYATQYHRQMVIKNGLSPIHRLSFCGNLV